MPTIQLTVPQDDLDAEEKSALVDHMTRSVSQFYADLRDEDVREFVNVRIVETAENGYAVGGEIIG